MNENEIRQLFAPLNQEMPGEKFATEVVLRVNRQTRMRVIVLGLATVIGLTIALVPLGELLIASVRTIFTTVQQYGDRTSLHAYLAGLVSLLTVGISVSLVRFLERHGW